MPVILDDTDFGNHEEFHQILNRAFTLACSEERRSNQATYTCHLEKVRDGGISLTVRDQPFSCHAQGAEDLPDRALAMFREIIRS